MCVLCDFLVLFPLCRWYGVQLALSVRGGCIGMLYAKSLSMHTSHRHEYSSGRISNLASVDGDNMMNLYWKAQHTTTSHTHFCNTHSNCTDVDLSCTFSVSACGEQSTNLSLLQC